MVSAQCELIAGNESLRRAKLFYFENRMPFFNIYRLNFKLWFQDGFVSLACPALPEGTMHLYALERAGERSLFLAVFEAEGCGLKPDWFGGRIRQIQTAIGW